MDEEAYPFVLVHDLCGIFEDDEDAHDGGHKERNRKVGDDEGEGVLAFGLLVEPREHDEIEEPKKRQDDSIGRHVASKVAIFDEFWVCGRQKVLQEGEGDRNKNRKKLKKGKKKHLSPDDILFSERKVGGIENVAVGRPKGENDR